MEDTTAGVIVSSVGDGPGKDAGIQPGDFKIIARGPDLPNDVLVAAPHVDKAVVEKVVKAINDNSDELIANILKGDDNQKYRGMRFLAEIEDGE